MPTRVVDVPCVVCQGRGFLYAGSDSMEEDCDFCLGTGISDRLVEEIPEEAYTPLLDPDRERAERPFWWDRLGEVV